MTLASQRCPAARRPDIAGCPRETPCRAATSREEVPRDRDEARLLAVLRFIGAAYETGDAACWEAAHQRAEETLDTVGAAQLVGRAAAVVRVIRIDRPDFGFLPPPCRRLSADEAALFHLLRASGHERRALALAGCILDNVGGIRLLVSATRDLVLPCPATAPMSLLEVETSTNPRPACRVPSFASFETARSEAF